MAFTGQVLDNPISGERFIFHQAAADTGGELLSFDLVLAPDGQVPGATSTLCSRSASRCWLGP